MIKFRELTEDDKKFVDEKCHELGMQHYLTLALVANTKGTSLREADDMLADFVKTEIDPIMDEHVKKHMPNLSAVMDALKTDRGEGKVTS